MADAHRYTLPRTPDLDAELVGAELFSAGALGVWERPDTLVAWFDAPTDAVPVGGVWEVEPDRDWQAEWKATIRPVHAGRVAIVPTWLAEDHVPADGEVTLVLDPGRAFGSGHHATTTMCLELLQGLDLVGARVLDVGCGTGVLALAAARLGADEVQAVDVDPEAVAVTGENASRNGLEVTVRRGSVEAAGGTAGVVLANLATDTVVALAERLVAATRPGGALIVSGIATERAARAIGALTAAGLAVAETRTRDGWTAVLGHTAPRGPR